MLFAYSRQTMSGVYFVFYYVLLLFIGKRCLENHGKRNKAIEGMFQLLPTEIDIKKRKQREEENLREAEEFQRQMEEEKTQV